MTYDQTERLLIRNSAFTSLQDLTVAQHRNGYIPTLNSRGLNYALSIEIESLAIGLVGLGLNIYHNGKHVKGSSLIKL